MTPDVTDRRLASAAATNLPRRRWLAGAAWAVAALAGFAVYLRLARTWPVTSDGSSQALQAWDLLHGNVLLSGWTTTDAPLYTTEVPEYLLVEVARGLGADVVHVAAAITYTLVVVLAAALAKGTATGREALLRVAMAAGIMLAPELVWGTNELVSSPDHIGTCVPVLLTWLILDRCGRRWWVPVLTTVLLAWATAGDELVLAIAVLPLTGVCAMRSVRAARRWYELSLAGGAVAAGAAGWAAPRVIHALGGFSSTPLTVTLSPWRTITHHDLPLTGKSLLVLFGAYLPGQHGSLSVFAVLHVTGLALAACGVAVTAWRFFRGGELVPQVLLAGIVIDVAAYVAGTHAAILANAREISPVLPFAAILAARQLSPWLLRLTAARRAMAMAVLGAALAGYAAGLGVELTAPAAPPQNARLTAWLMRHPLGGTGLSGYWEANVVTLTSANSLGVRPLNVAGGRVIPHHPNTKAAWFDPARSYADFVVLGPPWGDYGYQGFTNRKAVVATFGKPARVYHVGPYTIMRWHKNLLADLRADMQDRAAAR